MYNNGPMDMFGKIQNEFFKAFGELTKRQPSEFSQKTEGGEQKIFVEGCWITFNEFVEKYKNMRTVLMDSL